MLTDRTLGRATHRLIGTITFGVLSCLAWCYPLDGFPQAMTTALVVLMVPVSAQGARSPYQVVQRMCHRLLGCARGCLVVFAVFPSTAGSITDCLLAVCIFDISYVGTQLGTLIIQAFVHDGVRLSDNVAVAYHRLIGIAAENVALAVTLIVVTVISFRQFGRQAD